MRVLIALLSVAAGACYSPGVEDCQFRCGPGNACPDGTSCMNGFCRSETTGTCATGDACMVAPAPPAGCSQKIPLDGATACATICQNMVPWLQARMECANAGWQLAILDSAAKLGGLPQTIDRYWVGASRMTSAGPWMWINNTPVAVDAWSTGLPPPGSGGDCASWFGLNRKLSNANSTCTDGAKFACTLSP